MGNYNFDVIKQCLKKGYYMIFCDTSLNYIIKHHIFKQYIQQIYDINLNIVTVDDYNKFLIDNTLSKYLNKIHCVRIRDGYINTLTPSFNI